MCLKIPSSTSEVLKRLINVKAEPVVQECKHFKWDTEAGKLCAQSQPGLSDKTLPQKTLVHTHTQLNIKKEDRNERSF